MKRPAIPLLTQASRALLVSHLHFMVLPALLMLMQEMRRSRPLAGLAL